MRLALESMAMLADLVDTVEFLPCAVPPHKKAAALLPFELRAKMIKAAIADFPRFKCNEMEGERGEPSYTYETLRRLSKETEPEKLYFLIGSEDFSLLPTWRMGVALAELCNFVVAPRGNFGKKEFLAQCHEFWPDAQIKKEAPGNKCMNESGCAIRLKSETCVYWLPLPYLSISASRIRRLWQCGESIDYLMPLEAQAILKENPEVVETSWTGE